MLTRSAAWRAQRAAQRGVTLLEIAMAATALTAIAGVAVAFSVPRAETQRMDSAVRAAADIRDAAEEWRRGHPDGCPTLSVLLHDRELSRDAITEDPWGTRFRLRCNESAISVSSAGKDGRFGTEDDVKVPGPTS
jgi:hypothetical protein